MEFLKENDFLIVLPVYLRKSFLSKLHTIFMFIEVSRCPVFVIGDGLGAKEKKISTTLTGNECIKACSDLMKTDTSVNGVTMRNDGQGGCYCEVNMTRVKRSSTEFKTCSLDTKMWRDDGRCGPSFKLQNGEPGQCNPEEWGDRKGPCCSTNGWCGDSDAHCLCDGCVDYNRTGEVYYLLVKIKKHYNLIG